MIGCRRTVPRIARSNHTMMYGGSHREQFPEHLAPAVGQRLQLKQEGGDPLEVRISDLDEQAVTLDANHPLAGYTLTFNIQLVYLAAWTKKYTLWTILS
jgi:FKBP-type peptidyl-prolyl cis-trans isomerase 2